MKEDDRHWKYVTWPNMKKWNFRIWYLVVIEDVKTQKFSVWLNLQLLWLMTERKTTLMWCLTDVVFCWKAEPKLTLLMFKRTFRVKGSTFVFHWSFLWEFQNLQDWKDVAEEWRGVSWRRQMLISFLKTAGKDLQTPPAKTSRKPEEDFFCFLFWSHFDWKWKRLTDDCYVFYLWTATVWLVFWRSCLRRLQWGQIMK